MITLRPYDPADAAALLDLFRQTVRTVNRRDYTAEQVAAWASESIDPSAWSDRFRGRITTIAQIDDQIVGFADLATDGYLDRLFVSAHHQRQGIGARLLGELLARAEVGGIATVSTDASITAKPFFEAFGFRVVRQQRVECRGMTFINYRMQRKIATVE